MPGRGELMAETLRAPGAHQRARAGGAQRRARPLGFLLLGLLSSAEGAQNPLRRLRLDWAALNTRVTARHLMRPRTDGGKSECHALKAEVASAVAAGEFVVDAFARVAREHSVDEDTRAVGGLLGERFRQGWVKSNVLDRKCFVSTLGDVSGPFESEVGWHLVLAEERFGCRQDDGMVRVVPRAVGGTDGERTRPFVRSVLIPPGEAEAREAQQGQLQALAATAALWLVANMLGGAFTGAVNEVTNALLEGQ
jgi:hypothetical protein